MPLSRFRHQLAVFPLEDFLRLTQHVPHAGRPHTELDRIGLHGFTEA
jgi:hypothetical protein